MLKPIALALALFGAVTFTANAADEKEEKKAERKRPELTEEQKATRKQITEKYDTDKDGKLSPEERKAISAEDKEKLAKARPAREPKKKEEAK